MDRRRVERWLTTYEKAWRTAGVDMLGELFTSNASYQAWPWAEPVEGLEAIAGFWEIGRRHADEAFTLRAEVVAVELETAVVRADVDYDDDRGSWHNLWVVVFTSGGRCTRFEEWPFAPGQLERRLS